MKGKNLNTFCCFSILLGLCLRLSAEDDLTRILQESTGVYSSLPKGVVTISYTKGPNLGNGEFGMTIGGTRESQTLYMNRVDFGAKALGGVTILAERGSFPPSYQYEQDLKARAGTLSERFSTDAATFRPSSSSTCRT